MVSEWAGVSAGAAMAMLFRTGEASESVAFFEGLTGANPKNVYPLRLLRGQRPFPHEPMYRAALAHNLRGDAFRALQRGAPLRILQAYIEAGAPRYRTALRGLGAYRQQKRRGDLHGAELPPPGIGWRVVTAQELPSPAALIDAIVASSASPPITRVFEDGARTLVDGGLVDNVPLRALSRPARAGRVLTLLTRYQDFGGAPAVHSDDRLYLAPSKPTPVAKFDYTNPRALRATFELGLADGDRWREVLRRFLAGAPRGTPAQA